MDYRPKKAISILLKNGPKEFVKKLESYFNYLINIFYLPILIFKIKNLSLATDLDKLVNLAFEECHGIIKPQQKRSEILKLLEILVKKKHKYILKIGTAEGGTLFLLSRIASDNALIITVDLPNGGFDKGSYPKWKIPLFKSFVSRNQKIHLIRGNSHESNTLIKIKLLLKENKIDLLFIDGDHTYAGVKKDFEMYSSLVGKGGVIVFHDIVIHPPDTGCEVSNFWKEIKLNYKNLEIIENWNQVWGGIGFIIK